VRALQEGFARELGMPPLAYLRQVRLDRAWADLVQAEPTATTVAEVALRWGFAHLGRFSAAYSQRFGEYPKDTLRG
jgi:transcriptional regulator GlxA family with amidase domain